MYYFYVVYEIMSYESLLFDLSWWNGYDKKWKNTVKDNKLFPLCLNRIYIQKMNTIYRVWYVS